MKRFLTLLFLLIATPAFGQYARTLCSSLTLGSTVKATCFDYTDFKLYYWNGSAWVATTSTGAPADATYITKTANSTLSGEQAIGALSTGLLKGTTSTGTISIGAAGTDFVGPGSITTSALTQNTAKLLGRNTASSGAVEEITLGTNLSFSGTTLNSSAGAGGYATIQEEGSGLTARTTLNFVGSSITCADEGGTKTTCTVTGGGSSFNTKTPDQVTGLIGWWEADAITGLSDNDPVTTWPDQAGTPHDFTQSTAGNKPLFKTGQANGLPAVRFDDTDDGMDSTLVTTNPYTVMIIANNRSFPTSDNQRWVQGKTVNAFIGIANGFGTTLGVDIFNGSSALTKSVVQLVDQSFAIVTYSQAANDQRAYMNGLLASQVQTASPSAWGANGISFGATGQEASQPANADIIAMAIWDNVISPEDRLAVEFGFRIKYSLSH